jgi:hypothetical protein
MKKPFITYYEHIAKLATVANKQTLFLAHLLHRMEFDEENKIMYVDLSPMIKREIIRDIGAASKKPALLASQYLNTLQKAGLIKSIGSSRWLIDPMSYTYGSFVPKNLRERSSRIFNELVYSIDGECISHVVTK